MARVAAWVLWGGWIGASILGLGVEALGAPIFWLFCALPLYWLVRSFWFGIYLGPDEIRIVSWIFTYKVPRADVTAVAVRIYNGYLIRWSGGVDIFSSQVQIIGFERKSRKRKLYPGTAMTNRRAKQVAILLAEELDVPRTVASHRES